MRTYIMSHKHFAALCISRNELVAYVNTTYRIPCEIVVVSNPL